MRAKWLWIPSLAVSLIAIAGLLVIRKHRALPPPSREHAVVIPQSEVSLSSVIRPRHFQSVGATPRMVYEKAQQDYETAVAEFETMRKAARAAADTLKSAMERLDSSKKLLVDKSSQLEEAQGAYQAGEIRSPVDGLVVSRKG